MPLFDVGTGFFAKGVVDQSNKNRALGIQEATLDLQRGNLARQIDNDQKEQAMGYISEMVSIASEMKKNYIKTSEEFRDSETGRSAQALLEKAEELASQVGIPFSGAAAVNSTPTKGDLEVQEITAAIERVEQSEGRPGVQKALGVDVPPKVKPYLFPDGSRQAVDESNPKELAAAKNAGAYPVSLGVQGTSINDLTGRSPKEVSEIRQSAETSAADLQTLTKALDAFVKTPEAGGISGALIENGLGIVAQIPLVGDDVANAIADPELRQAVKDARTQARFAASSMLSTITKEESRFTDTERKLATDTLAALNVSQDPLAIQQALRTAIGMVRDSMVREIDKVILESGVDLNTDEGLEKASGILVNMGLDSETIIDVLARLQMKRGF